MKRMPQMSGRFDGVDFRSHSFYRHLLRDCFFNACDFRGCDFRWAFVHRCMFDDCKTGKNRKCGSVWKDNMVSGKQPWTMFDNLRVIIPGGDGKTETVRARRKRESKKA